MNRVKDKKKLHNFSKKIHATSAEDAKSTLKEYYHEDAVWHGPEPINKLEGLEEISSGYWEPLLRSFPDLQKDDYILFAGNFEGSDWVCATGNLVGTFEEDWLNIPATGAATWLRYGEFHRMVEGKIAETRIIVDILDLMRQAGYSFVSSLAPEVVIPGPSTQDGVILGERDEDETEKTLKLVEDMLFEGLASYEEKGLENMGMERYWHEDMMWYGPCGIGSTRGIDGFQDYHQGPFLIAFPDREAVGHIARFAEGNYCASTGWPSIEATHTGSGWLGLPATNKSVTMRVMDWWRREGGLLAENWVFIDMIDLLLQLEVDVFDRMKNERHLVG
jgi:predicted ester cyclase